MLGRARHPPPDQPLRGLAHGGQGGAEGDAPGGHDRCRRCRRLARRGPFRLHRRPRPQGPGRCPDPGPRPDREWRLPADQCRSSAWTRTPSCWRWSTSTGGCRPFDREARRRRRLARLRRYRGTSSPPMRRAHRHHGRQPGARRRSRLSRHPPDRPRTAASDPRPLVDGAGGARAWPCISAKPACARSRRPRPPARRTRLPLSPPQPSRLRLVISTAVIALASLAAWVWSARAGGAGDWRLTALLLTSLWPIALQLDWLPLALGRNRLAAALILVRPAAFVDLLLAILPLENDPTRLAWLFLAAWWLAALSAGPASPRRPLGRVGCRPGPAGASCAMPCRSPPARSRARPCSASTF
jgi:hypothetical protein